ncbi:hypothetical protein [Ferroplasma sp.]
MQNQVETLKGLINTFDWQKRRKETASGMSVKFSNGGKKLMCWYQPILNQ